MNIFVLQGLISTEDFDNEIVESIEEFQATSGLNQVLNPLKLYDVEEVDHDDLSGQTIFRSFSLGKGVHLFSTDKNDISGYVQFKEYGYLLRENPSFEYDADGNDIYQLDGGNGDILYTGDLNEIKYVLETLDYDFNGFAFRVGEGEVTRLYNQTTGFHHFTGDVNEVESLVASGDWITEGTI